MQDFTGHKDTDRLVMDTLDDETLFSFCQTNRYIHSLCNEDYWKRRTMERYATELHKLDRSLTWREKYRLLAKYYISGLEKSEHGLANIYLDKNSRLINESFGYIQDMYNDHDEKFRQKYDLMTGSKARDIVGILLAKEMAKYGPANERDVIYKAMVNVAYEVTEENSPHSLLVLREKSKPVTWSNEFHRDAVRGNYYGDVTRGGLVSLKSASEMWKEDPNYTFLPDLRLSGKPDDIIRELRKLTQDEEYIRGYLNNGYTPDSITREPTKSRYEMEVRGL